MVRPVTPTDDPKSADSYHITKDKQSTSITTNNSSSCRSKPSERKIIVTGNPENLLTKLFENVEEKAIPKKPEVSATGANYKTPVPPANNIRRGR